MGNSVAIATFSSPAQQLAIESEVIIQQYNQAPLDFLVDEYAVDYPFVYTPDDREVLLPYMNVAEHRARDVLVQWLAKIWRPEEKIQTYALLKSYNFV